MGHVVYTGFSDAGGVVFVAVPNKQYSYYFLHLNDIAVKKDDIIEPGQLIGHSGGDVGDNVLHDGKVQPALDISWFHGHSTGHHTEFGFFKGLDIATLNKGWGNRAAQLDPTPVYNWLRQHGSDYAETIWPDGSGGGVLGGIDWGSLLGGIFGGGLLSNAGSNLISAAFQNGFKALGFTDAKNATWRIMVGLAGASTIVAGMVIIGAELVGGAVNDVAKQPVVKDAIQAVKP